MTITVEKSHPKDPFFVKQEGRPRHDRNCAYGPKGKKKQKKKFPGEEGKTKKRVRTRRKTSANKNEAGKKKKNRDRLKAEGEKNKTLGGQLNGRTLIKRGLDGMVSS